MRARKHIRSTSMMTIELFDVISVSAGIFAELKFCLCLETSYGQPRRLLRPWLTPNLSVRGD